MATRITLTVAAVFVALVALEYWSIHRYGPDATVCLGR